MRFLSVFMQTTEEKTSENDAETVQDADFEEVK